TMAGTKKISSQPIGTNNYDPLLFAYQDQLLYTTNQIILTELWSIDLITDLDSMFAAVKPAGSLTLDPYVFNIGEHIIYAHHSIPEGNEYWVYTPLQTGISELVKIPKMTVFPNPAKDLLFISFEDLMSSPYYLRIYNSEGTLVWNKNVFTEKEKIDIHDFIPGQYFILLDNIGNCQRIACFVKE